MINQLAIAAGLLLCATIYAKESKVTQLIERDAEVLKLVQENLSAYDSGNERTNSFLRIFAATKVFQVEIGGNDYALILTQNQIRRWPGYNPVLVLLLNSELRPIACELIGGEQIFEAAYFQKDKLELVTYSRARPVGTYTQKVKVSATGLSSEEAIYSEDLDCGDNAQFTLSNPKAKDAESGPRE